MDVCIRFNDDFENDYTFTIDKKATVDNYLRKMFSPNSILNKMFSLRPSIFYERIPTKFYKSVCPGTLTAGGTILFNFEATKEKYLKELDPQKPLVDQLWPGQLIVPKWNIKKANILKYILIMSAWLYTDLPDMISPTPGICLTNQISKAFIPLMKFLDQPYYVEKLRSEIAINSSGKIAQILFFAFHVFKILVITIFFGLGMANPISFNLFKVKESKSLNVSDPRVRDAMKEIGWIGIKKAPYETYKNAYYNHVMKKYGGLVGAYRAGVVKRAANPGTLLEEGEGYATPLSDRGQNTFDIMEREKKYVLSDVYFKELEKDMNQSLKKIGKTNNIEAAQELIKNYKKFGLLEPNERIDRIIVQREEISGKYAYMESEEQKKIK